MSKECFKRVKEKASTNFLNAISLFKDIKIEEIVVLALIVLTIFEAPLSQITSLNFNVIDELLVIAIILLFVWKVITKKSNKLLKEEKNIFLLNILFIVVGIVGNIISKNQTNIVAIAIDLLSWQKFFVIFVFARSIIKEERAEKYYQIAVLISKILIIYGVVLEILNLLKVVNLYPGGERYGINVFANIGHPFYTAAIYACICAILMHSKKENKYWIILGLFLCLATLRTKAIVFAIFVLVFLLVDFNKLIKSISKIKVIMIITILVAIIGAISFKSIEFYFLDTQASRSVLLQTSIKIANEYAPTGSGFATFGTITSGKYYSKIYYKYGLDNKTGFTPNNYSYIGDGGLATIIGQFGYIGLGLIVLELFYMLKLLVINKRKSIDSKIPIACLLIYLFISSTNEIAFNSTYSIIYAVTISVFCIKGNVKDKSKELKK